jgi:predicted 3-demethylubiquinone-9 3-methyltransferase (glyoxalase superfamily)
MQKIITFLTFNDQAEEAVNFYVSVFDDSRITDSAVTVPKARVRRAP